MSLKQTRSVKEYLQEYEELVSQLTYLPDHFLESAFKNGLKPEIRDMIRVFEPQGIDNIISMSLRLEGCRLWSTGLGVESGDPNNSSGCHQRNSGNRQDNIKAAVTGNGLQQGSDELPHSEKGSSSRRLTEAEIDENRRRGLCFRCDEKSYVEHRCKNKGLRVILVEEVGELLLEEDELHCQPLVPPLEMHDRADSSINSAIGLTSPKTFKMKGCIGDQEVVVMINSGATHNFLSVEVICRAVVLKLQNLEIVADFLPLELGNADVILGVQWLRTLREIQMDFECLEMKFGIGNGETMVTVKGDPNLHTSLVSSKSSMKPVQQGEQSFRVELGALTGCGVFGWSWGH
ncbi:PREDICTED: uncharacterized protein LOC104824625 [Tarenaya hassleriana]|uniref:uncharacterized protein LOC104824625 n=1 Tax=Tarenaya hassleriana TaxID=28532 RepID=UPI00053C9D81|nr:PREDICTED: uncharacterized protein LOC104824625 [Tarenaya hassleriana]